MPIERRCWIIALSSHVLPLAGNRYCSWDHWLFLISSVAVPHRSLLFSILSPLPPFSFLLFPFSFPLSIPSSPLLPPFPRYRKRSCTPALLLVVLHAHCALIEHAISSPHALSNFFAFSMRFFVCHFSASYTHDSLHFLGYILPHQVYIRLPSKSRLRPEQRSSSIGNWKRNCVFPS